MCKGERKRAGRGARASESSPLLYLLIRSRKRANEDVVKEKAATTLVGCNFVAPLLSVIDTRLDFAFVLDDAEIIETNILRVTEVNKDMNKVCLKNNVDVIYTMYLHLRM